VTFTLCINRWAYPNSIPISEAMSHAKGIGYDCFEPNVEEEDLKLDQGQLERKWREVASNAESLGLRIPSVSTSLYWRRNMLLDQELDAALEVAKVQARVANILGAKVMLVVPGVAVPELSYEAQLERARRAILRVSKVSSQEGVKVGVENVWNRVVASPLDMRRLVDNLSPDWVGVYFDAGNTLPQSLPEQWIRTLGGSIVAVQVKDFSLRDMKFGIPFTGNVNWINVRKALEEVAYSGPITAEISPYPGDPHKASFDTYHAMRQVFK